MDSSLAEIDRMLASKTVVKLPTFTDEQIRESLQRERRSLCEALVGDPEVAKREILKIIEKLVLPPKQATDRTILAVPGNVELFQHYILPQIKISLSLDPSSPLAA